MLRTSPESNSTSTAAWANCEPTHQRRQNLEGEKDDRREDRPWHQLHLFPRRPYGGLGAVSHGAARCPDAGQGQTVSAKFPGVGGAGDVAERCSARQGDAL